MYRFKRIIVCIEDRRGEVSHILDKQPFASYEEAHEWLQSKGFKHYLFVFKEVDE